MKFCIKCSVLIFVHAEGSSPVALLMSFFPHVCVCIYIYIYIYVYTHTCIIALVYLHLYMRMAHLRWRYWWVSFPQDTAYMLSMRCQSSSLLHTVYVCMHGFMYVYACVSHGHYLWVHIWTTKVVCMCMYVCVCICICIYIYIYIYIWYIDMFWFGHV
jgi:hypothetical protein